MPINRSLVYVSDQELVRHLKNVPSDQYVIWTGHQYHYQLGSSRSRTLACITEIATPVSVKEAIARAARLDGQRGVRPTTARNGISNHQGSKPAAYILARLLSNGDYVCLNDVKLPGPKITTLVTGSVVLDRSGRPCFDVAKRADVPSGNTM